MLTPAAPAVDVLLFVVPRRGAFAEGYVRTQLVCGDGGSGGPCPCLLGCRGFSGRDICILIIHHYIIGTPSVLCCPEALGSAIVPACRCSYVDRGSAIWLCGVSSFFVVRGVRRCWFLIQAALAVDEQSIFVLAHSVVPHWG